MDTVAVLPPPFELIEGPSLTLSMDSVNVCEASGAPGIEASSTLTVTLYEDLAS